MLIKMSKKYDFTKLVGVFLLLYGLLFLMVLFTTTFNFDINVLDNFFTVGLLILVFTPLGKFIISFVAAFSIISGIGMIQLKKWGRKLAMYLCGLMILFLVYLVVGIIMNIHTGHQTSASLTMGIAIPFLPFALISIYFVITEFLSKKSETHTNHNDRLL